MNFFNRSKIFKFENNNFFTNMYLLLPTNNNVLSYSLCDGSDGGNYSCIATNFWCC